MSITMECTLVAWWYSAHDAMHEIHCLIPNVMRISYFVFLSTYQYMRQSTHQVHIKYRPGTYWYILVKDLVFQVQTNT